MTNVTDFADKFLRDVHALRDERLAKERAAALRPKLPYRAFYQVWDCALGYWRECEFFLFAQDRIEAKRLAVKFCRDDNGQPIDYYNMEIEQVAK